MSFLFHPLFIPIVNRLNVGVAVWLVTRSTVNWSLRSHLVVVDTLLLPSIRSVRVRVVDRSVGGVAARRAELLSVVLVAVLGFAAAHAEEPEQASGDAEHDGHPGEAEERSVE